MKRVGGSSGLKVQSVIKKSTFNSTTSLINCCHDGRMKNWAGLLTHLSRASVFPIVFTPTLLYSRKELPRHKDKIPACSRWNVPGAAGWRAQHVLGLL